MTEVAPPPLLRVPPLIIAFIYYYLLLGSMCVMQSFGFNNTMGASMAAIPARNMSFNIHPSAAAAEATTTRAAHIAATAWTDVGSVVSAATTATVPSTSPNPPLPFIRSTSNSILSTRPTPVPAAAAASSINNNNTTIDTSTKRASSSSSTTTPLTPLPFSSTATSASRVQVPDQAHGPGSMVQVTATATADSNANHATSLPTPSLPPRISGPTTVAATANALWPSSSPNGTLSPPPSPSPPSLLNSSTTITSSDPALFVRVQEFAYVAALRHHHHDVNTWGPHFEDNVPLNITITEGDDVLLDCRVGLLGDKLVSWVRRKSDRLDLLTFGSTNHSSDARIFSDFKYPNNWRLSIRNTTGNDSGVYLCQISTHPPKVLEVLLTVQAPRVFIVNSRGERINEVHYKEGSTLQLICTVNNIMSKSMSWYRNKDLLNQDVVRGGVNIKTDMTSSDQAKSILRVASVTRKDGGAYLCSAPPQNATVTVHILIGENPAELYRNPAPRNVLLSTTSTIVLYWICALGLVLQKAWIQSSETVATVG